MSPFSLTENEWIEGGPALVAGAYGVVTTSTATICVAAGSGSLADELDFDLGDVSVFGIPPSSGRHQLWMFGIGAKSNSVDASGTAASTLLLKQTPNIEHAYLPSPFVPDPLPLGGEPNQYNIAYLRSNEVIDPGGVAPASAYVFDASVDPLPLKSTAIPSQTAPRSFDGHADAMANYKDAHVLELKGGSGWLMVLGRYASADDETRVFGPNPPPAQADGDNNPDAGNSSAAIVAYWCSEPTFRGWSGARTSWWGATTMSKTTEYCTAFRCGSGSRPPANSSMRRACGCTSITPRS